MQAANLLPWDIIEGLWVEWIRVPLDFVHTLNRLFKSWQADAKTRQPFSQGSIGT